MVQIQRIMKKRGLVPQWGSSTLAKPQGLIKSSESALPIPAFGSPASVQAKRSGGSVIGPPPGLTLLSVATDSPGEKTTLLDDNADSLATSELLPSNILDEDEDKSTFPTRPTIRPPPGLSHTNKIEEVSLPKVYSPVLGGSSPFGPPSDAYQIGDSWGKEATFISPDTGRGPSLSLLSNSDGQRTKSAWEGIELSQKHTISDVGQLPALGTTAMSSWGSCGSSDGKINDSKTLW